MYVATDLHTRPFGEIRQHLEAVVTAVLPENGIEWFANVGEYVGDMPQGVVVRPSECLPDDVVYSRIAPMVSVRSGYSEGVLLECGLTYSRKEYKGVEFALFGHIKSFGSVDECWQVARVMEQEMCMIFGDQQMSLLPQLAAKLPKEHSWDRGTTLAGEVNVGLVQDDLGWQVNIGSARGDLVDSADFKVASPTAYGKSVAEQAAIQYATAWTFLLTRQPQGSTVRPVISSDLAKAIDLAVPGRRPGGYGVVCNPFDFSKVATPKAGPGIGLG